MTPLLAGYRVYVFLAQSQQVIILINIHTPLQTNSGQLQSVHTLLYSTRVSPKRYLMRRFFLVHVCITLLSM